MNKRLIKLTEQDLHRIVKESVIMGVGSANVRRWLSIKGYMLKIRIRRDVVSV